MTGKHLHDWPKIIAELESGGMTCYKIAMQLGIDPTTVKHWRKGGEPSHYSGVALLAIHARETNASALVDAVVAKSEESPVKRM